jgi:hypothetical protein
MSSTLQCSQPRPRQGLFLSCQHQPRRPLELPLEPPPEQYPSQSNLRESRPPASVVFAPFPFVIQSSAHHLLLPSHRVVTESNQQANSAWRHRPLPSFRLKTTGGGIPHRFGRSPLCGPIGLAHGLDRAGLQSASILPSDSGVRPQIIQTRALNSALAPLAMRCPRWQTPTPDNNNNTNDPMLAAPPHRSEPSTARTARPPLSGGGGGGDGDDSGALAATTTTLAGRAPAPIRTIDCTRHPSTFEWRWWRRRWRRFRRTGCERHSRSGPEEAASRPRVWPLLGGPLRSVAFVQPCRLLQRAGCSTSAASPYSSPRWSRTPYNAVYGRTGPRTIPSRP